MTTTTIEELGFEFPELTDGQAVADWLYAEGIRGRRHDPCKCPIARLLRDTIETKWPATTYIGVVASTYSQESVSIQGYLRCSDGVTDHIVDLPEAVLHFVYHFDRGAYPHLEER